jgi:hypothetical protein
VEQTADVFRAALGNLDVVLEHHSAFDDERSRGGDDVEETDGAEKLRLAGTARSS